jgi:uncharacterized protein (DUF433 family)
MAKKKIHTIVSRNKEILGGTPVFKGTRVPDKILWNYLKGGETVEDFLEGFPSVNREQVIALIERAQQRVASARTLSLNTDSKSIIRVSGFRPLQAGDGQD